MGKESVLPLGTELPAPLESTAAPGLGSSRGLPREVLGMRVEFGTLLSASCQHLKHKEALILTSTSPQQTSHHYSQRIGSFRTVLKWGLLLLCHGQWPTQLCLLKEEWEWGALWIYEADCVRLLWLPFIPKCLDWLWKAVTQIDFYWADSLSMFERTQVKDGVSHPIQAVCQPTKGVGQPEGRVSWLCFFW